MSLQSRLNGRAWDLGKRATCFFCTILVFCEPLSRVPHGMTCVESINFVRNSIGTARVMYRRPCGTCSFVINLHLLAKFGLTTLFFFSKGNTKNGRRLSSKGNPCRCWFGDSFLHTTWNSSRWVLCRTKIHQLCKSFMSFARIHEFQNKMHPSKFVLQRSIALAVLVVLASNRFFVDGVNF